MSNIKQAEELLNEEIAVLESQIEKIKSALLLLGNKVEAPATVVEPAVPNVIVEDEEQIRLQFEGYPVEGKQRDKVRFILTNYNRAISEPEFERVVKIMEGVNAQSTLDVFQRTLRGMTHPKTGEILHFNFRNSKKRFYIKPDWRSIDKTSILLEKMPVVNTYNGLDASILVNPTFNFKVVE